MYYFIVIVMVGMGFFMDVYDFFSIFLVIKLFGCIYYYKVGVLKFGVLFFGVLFLVIGVVFVGILVG